MMRHSDAVLRRWSGQVEDYRLAGSGVFEALRAYWLLLKRYLPSGPHIVYMGRADYVRLTELWRYQWAVPHPGVPDLVLAWLDAWDGFSVELRRVLLLVAAGYSNGDAIPLRFAGEVRRRLEGLGAFCKRSSGGLTLLGNFRFFTLAFQEQRVREGLRLALETWRQGVR